ncbi:MAG TPA: TIGR04282 family arsenosugar biosynthesis glycosyltransferase [Acetobacteraceae bacterium]|nr:TIGR04282 family arsenosugar biosynthesis glycosyltransferase [Acetobacteraceae bacterium]
MRDTAIVFARAPRLGAVKRRLGREIGARAALRFYLRTLSRLLRALAADPRFRTVLAITPDGARFRLLPSMGRRVTRIGQGSGDLGTRMARALARFPHRRAALIGCDIPDAGPAELVAAFQALGRAEAAFGPAEDGGFWLVALGPRRPAQPFARVRWSGPHALADTLRRFRGRKVALLRRLRDVDTAADLAAMSRDRGRYPAPARCASASRSRSGRPPTLPPPAPSPG